MIAFEIIDKIYETWGTDYKNEIYRKADIDTLEMGTPEDKTCCINSLYGIFDGKVKGNIYTYYYWTSDVSIGSIFNYSGKTRERKWRELAHCCKVNYNYRTGNAEIKRVRWNKKCVENAGRIL